MKCEKCKKDFEEVWENKKTYNGIDIHHNPPEFISNFFKEEWSGEFYNLCREDHKRLHIEIKKILFKNSNLFKFVNNEDWLIKGMTPIKIRKAEKEIYQFTKKWVEKNGKN